MKVIVYHASYGCETGCCGHTIKLEDGRSAWTFEHPYGEDHKQWAKELVEAKFGKEHVDDLDWDNCIFFDD